MADVGLRDLGSFVPGGRTAHVAREPIAPPIPQDPSVIVTPPPRPEPARTVFAGDRPDGGDALGIDATLVPLAELATHRGTRGPICVGLLGGPGSGKSFALNRLATLIADLSAAAGKVTGQSPFLSRVHLETIDAAGLESDPTLAIAARLHGGLRRTYPDLARELGAAARDPHVVLREANEKLDDARRRLDTERRALDDASSRRARLTETVLYEAAGSQVDAFARAHRTGIESRLNGFGIGGEPIRAFKDLVQVVGSGGGTGLAVRALWAFKGQTRLIVAAIALVLLGIGLGIAIDDKTVWLGDLRGGPKAGAGLADWIQTHIDWLATARTATFALAALALVANLFRAVTFLRPVFRGARLLESDLDDRRRDLDGLYAHQTKRVDALERDVDRLTREVAEAERRAGGTDSRAPSEPSPFETASGPAQARGIFAALSTLMGDGKGDAPQRIVLVLDHFAGVSGDRARGLFDALQRMAGPGIVILAAVDPDRLDADVGDLERWIQVPVRLEQAGTLAAHGDLVHAALGREESFAALPRPDVRRSDLDAPIEDEEAALLVSLAALAGRTPRAVKRFANLYRLARLGEDRPLGILAFMLALAQGGTPAEQHVVAAALSGNPAAPFALPHAEGRLRDAFDAAGAAGGRVTGAEALAAARRAATFSIRPVAFV